MSPGMRVRGRDAVHHSDPLYARWIKPEKVAKDVVREVPLSERGSKQQEIIECMLEETR